jgi:hypothetical protein
MHTMHTLYGKLTYTHVLKAFNFENLLLETSKSPLSNPKNKNQKQNKTKQKTKQIKIKQNK